MSCNMYLVPEDIIDTWQAEQREQAVDKPIDRVVCQIDSFMSQILNMGTSDYDVEKLYSQDLAKKLDYDEKNNVTLTPIINTPL